MYIKQNVIVSEFFQLVFKSNEQIRWRFKISFLVLEAQYHKKFI